MSEISLVLLVAPDQLRNWALRRYQLPALEMPSECRAYVRSAAAMISTLFDDSSTKLKILQDVQKVVFLDATFGPEIEYRNKTVHLNSPVHIYIKIKFGTQIRGKICALVVNMTGDDQNKDFLQLYRAAAGEFS